jgi:hypothetical protein
MAEFLSGLNGPVAHTRCAPVRVFDADSGRVRDGAAAGSPGAAIFRAQGHGLARRRRIGSPYPLAAPVPKIAAILDAA